MDIAACLKRIDPGIEFICGATYDSIVILENGQPATDQSDKPTLESLQAAWALIEQEKYQEVLISAVDAFMDSKAQANGFRDRHSFALRAGIPGSSWHAQALVFGAWMDAVNDYCWQVQLDCLDGKRNVPTIETLLAELPVLTEGE